MHTLLSPLRPLLAVLAVAGLISACDSGSYDGLPAEGNIDPPGGNTDIPLSGDAVQGKNFYLEQCQSCHGSSGSGTPAGPALAGCASCTDELSLVDRIVTTMPPGRPEACGLSCSQAVAAFVFSAFNGDKLEAAGSVLQDITKAAPERLLHKAALNLAGRLPTAGEYAQVQRDGDAGLTSVLDQLMQEPAFYARMLEIYNDILLQNKYLGGENALSLLRSNDFPQRRWYRDLGLSIERNNPQRDLYYYLRAQTNDAVGQEALRLIEYVLKNQRPFTEVLTADYMVANYYSARAYGAEDQHAWRVLADPPYSDPDDPLFALAQYDPEDFRPVRIANQLYEIPHAGLMTSAMFLNRFPTTETNRNRHRSRMVYQLFLDTDILQLGGTRPGEDDAVDISSPIPTLDNPSCLVCHEVLDPVASIFQNWTELGQYRPSHYHDGWHTDMEPRGFSGQTMDLTGETVNASVRWLAGEIANDPRFATATVKTLHQGLTGQPPLTAPPAETAIDDPQRVAFEAQNAYFSELKRVLLDNGFRLRPLIREIIRGPYFAAAELVAGADAAVHKNSGSARLLTPEMLHRKIEAVSGYPWRYRNNDRLLSSRNDSLRILYGGIDSDDVTTRLTEPNGIMAAVQLRMANEMACYALSRDFFKPAAERHLFPHVEISDSLLSAEGLVDTAARARIIQNLQHLVRNFFGRELLAGSSELNEWLTLIQELQVQGRAAMDGSWQQRRINPFCALTRHPESNESLPREAQIYEDELYVLRAWQAVLVILFSDYEFLYE